MQIPEFIFKSYDIRGVVDTELDESTAYLIGAATVATLRAKRLAVGRDMRSHSPRLEAALIRGITAAGADVVSIGQCSTPMSYFAVATLDVDGAVMVTASHNPGQDNGFKFSKRAESGERGVQPMGMGTGLEIVRELVLSGKVGIDSAPQPGSVERIDLLDAWCRHLTQYLPKLRPRKIVVDCGNSIMGPILRRLLEHVDPDGKLEILWLFEEPDGTFPWHPADPLTLVNLRHLQGAVLVSNADFGVAFDGDGDRLAFVDGNARFIGCDLMTALFARKILAVPENRGKKVLYDLRSSFVVKEEIEAAGGVAEMCRVGHSHIKAAMRGNYKGAVLDPPLPGEAVFAGELSGHFFFKDCFTIDTSERTFLLALDLMSDGDRSLADRIAPLRRYHHSGEINFRLPGQQAIQDVLQAVELRFPGARVFKLDGVTVQADSWWLNVRPSNTEPVLRFTAESLESPEALAKVISDVEGLIVEHHGTRKT
ncbi:MAG: phosphomannomutase/phosphoglucomutase [Planctomycetota bacterium]|nr:phosphomannomutase/phosphoglucomutase [Planctomycetota bacterium]